MWRPGAWRVRLRAVDEMTNHLGDQIRRWREAASLTQADLAELVGVQLITVSRWENGHATPYPRNMAAIRTVTENAVEAPVPGGERAPIYRLAAQVAGLAKEVKELRDRVTVLEDRGPDPGAPDAATDEAGDPAGLAHAIERSGELAAANDARPKGRTRKQREQRRP